MTFEFRTVKFKHGSKRYEVMVKPDLYRKYLENTIPKEKLLISDEVFEDAKKGNRASVQPLIDALGLSSQNELIEHILRNGEYSLSALERKELVKEIQKKLVNEIQSSYVSSTTNAPLSAQMINDCLTSAGVKIDPFKSANQQIDAVVAALSKELPLKKSRLEYVLSAEVSLAGSLVAAARKLSEVANENYEGQTVVISGSLRPFEMETFVARMNATAGGKSFDLKFPQLVQSAPEPKSKRKGKKK